MKGHVTIHVPEGHTVQVHPMGTEPHMSPQAGMIHDPAVAGALAAMDSALAVPGEAKDSPPDREQPKQKGKPKLKAGKADPKKGD